MKKVFVFSVALAAGFFIARCNGTRTAHADAIACVSDHDCGAGNHCTQSYCHYPDGGLILVDAGTPNDSGIIPPDPDSGQQCVNLECQQVRCVTGSTTLTGIVNDPAGRVPLFNALVYVPNGQVQPFTQGVSCDRCATASGSPLVSTSTGADGTFTLTNVPVGNNIPLVIQIGRWRRRTQVNVTACVTAAVDPNLTRLPKNQSEGDIPLMAIATGNADPFECLLRKIGISDSEFTVPTAVPNGRVHYYVTHNGSASSDGRDLAPPAGPAPDAGVLWDDITTLKKYDIVLLPCEGSPYPATKPPSAKQNLVDYTTAGGRVFITHYGYEWLANGAAPFPSTGNWQPDPGQSNNPPNPFTYTLDTTFPKGVAFNQWLLNVGATATSGQLSVAEGRRNIGAVTAPTTQWLYGTWPVSGSPVTGVAHLTFNTPVNPPALPDGGAGLQCGRIVFSDFHVTAGALSGQQYFPASCLNDPPSPQEKALEFMLFDLSSCVQNDRLPIIR